ncbi:SusD/RagB family nutrient-binding outer membrane lipoprotein [Pedobacter sp. HMF7647]|uniref:SusD/RagB family nutrient-binding outer membrane lipoprotein n=1 Tax=Hufsiella arboris TaxID=2695275 RepID=A0A7K1Y528_9SPHI|nr:SusD/RagB family nutrient-binding outer membrane lipoprotein [Hufsiella arboris]MXV49696.1 SusD/RagB family nutrient-binding outer membrane lipoprotein [Hufsiella arboris]
MKRTLYKVILSTAMLAAAAMSSCKKDFTEINTDPNGTPNALPSQLLAPALVNTLTYNMIRNRNFNNELMQVTVDMTDAEGANFRYDIRKNQADYLWNGWYSQLTNLKDLYASASRPEVNDKSYMGISLILQSWIFSMLTDTYGDIPYSEAIKGRSDLNFEPKFDKQKDIYLDIFKQLETANTLLTAATNVTANSDPVYGGNVTKWRKFGNSLYLRLLLRLSGKKEVSADMIAKIKEIVDTNAANYPIMASNDESAILKWTGTAPYTSPYVGVRVQDFRAIAIADFFIDHLVAWNDPRISIPLPYGNGTVNRWSIAPISGQFLGVPSGYAPNNAPAKQSYFYSSDQYPQSLQVDPMTGMIMNYAELQLILAEAAAKGWISGSAASYYTNGAKSSITQWIPTWPEDINTFLANADIQWVESETIDRKMEKIHLQKYYATFLEDLEQWFEYRRTGHPVLPKGAGLKNNGVMPARLNYPIYVQSSNPTNYKTAVSAQGTDDIATQVWWQKP